MPEITASLYLRYSTDEQGDQAFTTIDAQRAALTDYARLRGYRIVGEYLDEGRSGTNLRRPGYRALLAAAKAKEFALVLVTFMSRLGRGNTFVIAEHELRQAGVRVETAKEAFGSDVAGYAAQAATQLIDGMYPVMVRQWTETKMKQMLAMGYHCAGAAPFGYRIAEVEMPGQVGKKPKRLVPEPGEAQIVRRVFEVAARTGEVGDARRFLSEETGYPWAYGRVKRLLTSRIYRGVATWGDATNEAAHLPIIEADLFARAQEAIENPGPRPPRKVAEGDYLYYLRGNVYCRCGHLMTPYWAKGRGGLYRYYYCTRRSKFGRSADCSPGRVSADALHDSVFGEFAALARSGYRLRRTLDTAREMMGDTREIERQAAVLEKRLGGLMVEQDRLMQAVRMSPVRTLPLLLKQVELCQGEQEAARADLARTRGEIARAAMHRPDPEALALRLSRFAELWAAATERERWLLSQMLVEQVRFTGPDTFETWMQMDARLEWVKTPQFAVHERDGSTPGFQKGHLPTKPLTESGSNPSPQYSILSQTLQKKKRGQDAR